VTAKPAHHAAPSDPASAPQDSPYRALIVDYGGVLTTSVGASFAAFCLETGVDPERFKAIVAEAYGGEGSDGMIARVERGSLSPPDFERWLAEALSEGSARPVKAAGLRRRIMSSVRPDEAMIGAVGSLHAAGTRTALISNTWGPPVAYGARQMKAIFDAIVRSDEVGLRKPDPQIYLLTADRLEVPPTECVFVDDLLQNVEGARAVGMHAFVHRNAHFTLPRLEGLFGMSLSG
jgi:epoxide hydrolase-like predicted phosphatase